MCVPRTARCPGCWQQTKAHVPHCAGQRAGVVASPRLGHVPRRHPEPRAPGWAQPRPPKPLPTEAPRVTPQLQRRLSFAGAAWRTARPFTEQEAQAGPGGSRGVSHADAAAVCGDLAVCLTDGGACLPRGRRSLLNNWFPCDDTSVPSVIGPSARAPAVVKSVFPDRAQESSVRAP